MPECPNCGCDPTPAEKHRSIQFCYEALKTALAKARNDVALLFAAHEELQKQCRELEKKVPGPLRPKKESAG